MIENNDSMPLIFADCSVKKWVMYSHIIIVKLNSCSYNYIGVRVRLGLGFVGQRGKLGSGL